MPEPASRARLLDHLVLPVRAVSQAGQRLQSLGFTVAPVARHPFGTENACVFFADGTYLEPLGVADETACADTAKAGNVFTARDRAFRFRRGPEGLSAIVFKTTDASLDDNLFETEGMSGGRMLQFSRAFSMPDGLEHEATFKLAFASDLRSPDLFAFTCQRINVPAAGEALTVHDNGVTGIARVLLSEPDPQAFRDYLALASGQAHPSAGPHGLEFDTGNARISVMTPETLESRYGLRVCGHGRGLAGRAIVFHAAALDALAELLAGNGIDHLRTKDHILVPHADGQAVPFIFKERP